MGYLSRKDRMVHIAQELIRVGAIEKAEWSPFRWTARESVLILWLDKSNNRSILERDLTKLERLPSEDYPRYLATNLKDDTFKFLLEAALTHGIELCLKRRKI